MTRCVLDCSAAMAWVLPGEASAAIDRLLDDVAVDGADVPGLWPLEMANALWQAERRGRISRAERSRALALLADLPIRVDERATGLAFGPVSALASASNLTVYDACYVELAIRLNLALASLDRALCDAARTAGVRLALGR